jgi:hypothetical protein
MLQAHERNAEIDRLATALARRDYPDCLPINASLLRRAGQEHRALADDLTARYRDQAASILASASRTVQ